MTQERAGFGGAETLARMPDADGLEQPIHLGGAEGQELRPHGRRQCAGEWFIMFQPVGQRRLEELAAQRIAQEPEGLERRQQHGGLVAGVLARAVCGAAGGADGSRAAGRLCDGSRN
jgi:hypothetical protein